MKNLNNLLLIALILSVTIITSCKKEKEEETTISAASDGFMDGVLIANEGSYGSGNGSISYYNTSENTITNNIFDDANNRPLGDVVQSVAKFDGKAYICVNASNKLEIVNGKDFKSLVTLYVNQPRYFVADNDKGYISKWGDGGKVMILDLATNSISDSVDVGSGPEGMAIANNKLFVANSGGFMSDSTISIVDLSSKTVTNITIDAFNPNSITVDLDDNIWVLAKGMTLYDANWNAIGNEPSKLIKINSSTNAIEKTIKLFDDVHPTTIGISKNKDVLYYGGGFGVTGIYALGYQAGSALGNTPVVNESFYGFLINSSNGEIFALKDNSSSNGTLYRYDTQGTELGQYEVGVFPNGGTDKRD
jgi:sugar lactone lactonase YvrE